ncbi:MAG: hypothetical protein IT353_09720 [Gemmatimonadaceae bacterium]|nr:hypothetical protein [Gemmatimonadaceae bacterium]
MSASAMAVVVALTIPSLSFAQHAAASTLVPPPEAAQLNFLVGQWELTAKPKATTLGQRIHGVRALRGTWKAWRALDGWGLEDELRLTDGSGNPALLVHAVRFYDRTARRWTNSVIDVYKGVSTQSTGERRGAEVLISGRGTDEEGRAYLSRGTFTAVTAATFRYRLDRSMDGGKSWTEGVLIIEAKRVAAVAPR